MLHWAKLFSTESSNFANNELIIKLNQNEQIDILSIHAHDGVLANGGTA